MKVASLTDHIFSPASRFRFRQYIPILLQNGIEVHDYYRKFSTETASPRDGNIRIRDDYGLILRAILHETDNVVKRFIYTLKSNSYDAVWLSRQLIIGYPSFEFLINKPLIYDIDDAIFLINRLANLQFKITSERANAVIAGNDYLAEEASKYCKKVFVVPTAVDTDRWQPSFINIYDEQIFDSEEFRIGWCGTSSSYKYFLPLENDIKQFLLDFPSTKFILMSDRFPQELQILKPYINFIQWSVNEEVKFIQSLNVGLMPIGNDIWSKGKCAYKALLYAACSIPVIMTPTGVNAQLLAQSEIGIGPNNSKEWYEALRMMFFDKALAKRMGRNGVDLIAKDYSMIACAPKIAKIIREST